MLTPKQEAFCIAYVQTSNASEAYRQVYTVKPGTKDASVWRSAKDLMDNPKVASRLQELRKPAADAAQVTLEQHLKDLKRLRDLAEASEKYGPAIQAEVARGKAAGLYVEKLEHAGAGGGPLTVVVRKFSDG